MKLDYYLFITTFCIYINYKAVKLTINSYWNIPVIYYIIFAYNNYKSYDL